MNFLAHAVLAGSSPDKIAGSLAGDFVKGVLYEKDYPEEFLIGLRLHRRVDAFSNTEPYLRQSAQRLPKEVRRIAPPCIDMLADHFLADAACNRPQEYLKKIEGLPASAEDLKQYEDALHQVLAPHISRLSSQARRFFSHAQRTRLFSEYQQFERTTRGINHVCERLGHADKGPKVVDAIADNLVSLRCDFDNYWPALEDEANRYLAP